MSPCLSAFMKCFIYVIHAEETGAYTAENKGYTRNTSFNSLVSSHWRNALHLPTMWSFTKKENLKKHTRIQGKNLTLANFGEIVLFKREALNYHIRIHT